MSVVSSAIGAGLTDFFKTFFISIPYYICAFVEGISVIIAGSIILSNNNGADNSDCSKLWNWCLGSVIVSIGTLISFVLGIINRDERYMEKIRYAYNAIFFLGKFILYIIGITVYVNTTFACKDLYPSLWTFFQVLFWYYTSVGC